MSGQEFKTGQWAKIDQVKPGTMLVADAGFTCMAGGAIKEVKAGPDGSLYVDCASGHHDLAGQVEDDYYIGLTLSPLASETPA